ncbi:MAG: WD40/YVTN/BNR-like repeat-containing protein [Parahaliea sp.]
MSIRNLMRGAILVFPLLLTPGAQAQDKVYDVLELPAVKSDFAAKSLIYSVRKYGDRYFATGQRGHILYSDDNGDTWIQADVPVRSSILDIFFPSAEKGWAIGHEAVILHSDDGGKTWVKQYDGLRLAADGLDYYQEKVAEDPNDTVVPILADEMEFSASQGADKPLFSIYCFSDTACNAGGAYGIAIKTRDGGKTWLPTMHRNENLDFFHLFDATSLPGKNRFFLVGEAALFMTAYIDEDTDDDSAEGMAKRVETVPWNGSFFTVIDSADDAIIAGGLRGKMYRTPDEGDTWEAVSKPDTSAIVDSIRLQDNRLVVVGVAGEVLISTDNGKSFSLAAVDDTGPINSVAEGPDNTLILGGPKGLAKVTLP